MRIGSSLLRHICKGDLRTPCAQYPKLHMTLVFLQLPLRTLTAQIDHWPHFANRKSLL